MRFADWDQSRFKSNSIVEKNHYHQCEHPVRISEPPSLATSKASSTCSTSNAPTAPAGRLSRRKADRGTRPQGQYVEMVVRPEGRLPEARCTQPARSLRLG